MANIPQLTNKIGTKMNSEDVIDVGSTVSLIKRWKMVAVVVPARTAYDFKVISGSERDSAEYQDSTTASSCGPAYAFSTDVLTRKMELWQCVLRAPVIWPGQVYDKTIGLIVCGSTDNIRYAVSGFKTRAEDETKVLDCHYWSRMAFELSREVGHDFRLHKKHDHDIPGQGKASHVEAQLMAFFVSAVVLQGRDYSENPRQTVGFSSGATIYISKAPCLNSCELFRQKVEKRYGLAIEFVVLPQIVAMADDTESGRLLRTAIKYGTTTTVDGLLESSSGLWGKKRKQREYNTDPEHSEGDEDFVVGDSIIEYSQDSEFEECDSEAGPESPCAAAVLRKTKTLRKMRISMSSSSEYDSAAPSGAEVLQTRRLRARNFQTIQRVETVGSLMDTDDDEYMEPIASKFASVSKLSTPIASPGSFQFTESTRSHRLSSHRVRSQRVRSASLLRRRDDAIIDKGIETRAPFIIPEQHCSYMVSGTLFVMPRDLYYTKYPISHPYSGQYHGLRASIPASATFPRRAASAGGQEVLVSDNGASWIKSWRLQQDAANARGRF